MGASSGRAWSELAWRACDSIAVIRSQSISHAHVIATCDLAIGIDVRELEYVTVETMSSGWQIKLLLYNL